MTRNQPKKSAQFPKNWLGKLSLLFGVEFFEKFYNTIKNLLKVIH